MSIVSYPTTDRNYCLFDKSVTYRINNGEKELPIIKNSLLFSKSEDEIVEDLYILNCMLDNGTNTEKIVALYPELSKFNNTNSPDIQTYLAGIYRKTKIPDAFGPLVSMLIRNSVNATKENYKAPLFDPNEEVGGAILDYLA